MNNEAYIEVSLYRLNDGVSQDEFLQVSDEVTAVFQTFDGFSHRQLMQAEDGQFVDMAYWDSKVQAKAAEPAMYANEKLNTIMGMLNTEEMIFTHVSPLKEYGRI